MSGVVLLILRILLAVVLYLFLGLSLYILWRDMKQQREFLATRKEPSIGLRVEVGDTIETYHYQTFEIMIGRDPSCECSLPSEKVSAKHARLSFHNNQWWIEDLKSTNGSFLNNEAVLVPTVVASGDFLQFGNASVTISMEGSDLV
jgi:pSer/pThr/pTyr-binding forkhead associated (FHA) protein